MQLEDSRHIIELRYSARKLHGLFVVKLWSLRFFVLFGIPFIIALISPAIAIFAFPFCLLTLEKWDTHFYKYLSNTKKSVSLFKQEIELSHQYQIALVQYIEKHYGLKYIDLYLPFSQNFFGLKRNAQRRRATKEFIPAIMGVTDFTSDHLLGIHATDDARSNLLYEGMVLVNGKKIHTAFWISKLNIIARDDERRAYNTTCRDMVK